VQGKDSKDAWGIFKTIREAKGEIPAENPHRNPLAKELEDLEMKVVLDIRLEKCHSRLHAGISSVKCLAWNSAQPLTCHRIILDLTDICVMHDTCACGALQVEDVTKEMESITLERNSLKDEV
jgi:hypothetical protein